MNESAVKEHSMLFKGPMICAFQREVDPKEQTRRPITFDNSITDVGLTRKQWPGLLWDEAVHQPSFEGLAEYWKVPYEDIMVRVRPRIKVGDRVWAKETWRVGAWRENAVLHRGGVVYEGQAICIDYQADGFSRKEWLECNNEDLFDRLREQSIINAKKEGCQPDEHGNYLWYPGESPCKWRSSLLMSRFMSRMDFDVRGVRSQRIQDISEEDAHAEGIMVFHHVTDDGEDGYFDVPLGKGSLQTDTPSEAFHALWDSINIARGFGMADNHPVWAYDLKRVSND